MHLNNRRNSQHLSDDDNNIFWASMSDLLLGLLIVFIILFSLGVLGLTKQKIDQENIKQKIVSKLNKEFEKSKIYIDIEKVSGNIKISDLELFDLNSWTLSGRGKEYLNKFLPVYLNTLLNDPEIKKHISRIIIEGHTDSQGFKDSRDRYQSYAKNLDLSLKRAYAITEYVIDHNFAEKNKYKDDLIILLSTNGRSYSEPVITNGKEDFIKSRRVELKFQLKDNSIIDLLRKYKIKTG